MSLKDTLRPASFRGVPFLVTSAEGEFGRRNSTHEYPKRDDPYTEDMGRKADGFTFTAYLLGDDTSTTRRALIAAIRDKDTPGALVHPAYGTVQVIPGPCRHRIEFNEDRIEYFELSFSESGINKFPGPVADTQSAVSDAGETLIATLVTAFSNIFSVASLPQFVSDHAQAIGADIAKAITAQTSLKSVIADEAADLLTDVGAFSSNLSSLVTSPAIFADQASDLVLRIRDVYSDPVDALIAYKALMTFGSTYQAISQTTSTRRQQAKNMAQVVGAAKRSALIGMGKAMTEINFASYDDAVAARNLFQDYAEIELLALGDTNEDQTYLDLDGFRAQVVNDVTSRAANLKRIKTIYLGRVLPALVVSYNLYKTADRDDEIVQRNKVRHPGFLPAGKALQVLVG
jgi:prophage DNA circulation protein